MNNPRGISHNIEALKDFIAKNYPDDVCRIYEIVTPAGTPVEGNLGSPVYCHTVNGYSSCNPINRRYIDV